MKARNQVVWLAANPVMRNRFHDNSFPGKPAEQAQILHQKSRTIMTIRHNLSQNQAQAVNPIHGQPVAKLASTSISGRGLADDTPIPTPDGWVNLGDISPGRQLFDERGRPCTVVGVYPEGEQPVCRVRFDDRSFLLAGAQHEWVTLSHSLRAKIHKGANSLDQWAQRLMPTSTEDIRRSLRHRFGNSYKCVESEHSIPLAKALQLPEQQLPIDPYLLGIWLGDGSSLETAITCQEEDEPHYGQRARAAGENWRIRNRKKGKSGDILSCTLSGEPAPRFLTRLRELGVKGDKHIPPTYLRAGPEQRLHLMQGLMDTDGYIDIRGVAEYTSTSEKLAEGVLELAITLGQKATSREGRATLYGKDISAKWRICFTPTTKVVSLPRKMNWLSGFLRRRRKIALPRPKQRYIRTISSAKTRPSTSIAVDSPSGMFLAGRAMIPTRAVEPPRAYRRNGAASESRS